MGMKAEKELSTNGHEYARMQKEKATFRIPLIRVHSCSLVDKFCGRFHRLAR